MGTPVNIGSTSYTVASQGQRGWGPDTTTLLLRLANVANQVVTAQYTLTADVFFSDVSGTYAVKANFLKGVGAIASSDGFIRMASPYANPGQGLGYPGGTPEGKSYTYVSWRNSLNNADLHLFPNTDNETLQFAGRELVNADSIQTLENKTIGAGNSIAGTAIDAETIYNTAINANAAIAVSKLAPVTVSRLLVSDASGFITTVAVNPTEAAYLAGVTSAIQTQINTKLTTNTQTDNFRDHVSTNPTGFVAINGTGTWSSRTITAGSSKVVVTGGNGVASNPTIDVTEANLTLDNLGGQLNANRVGAGSVSNTQFGYLAGVSAAIQTQLDNKQPLDADLTAISAITDAGYLAHAGGGTWIAVAIADLRAAVSPLTTKGDLFTYSTVNTRLPIGANDYVLTADSTAATGMAWKVATGGTFTASSTDTVTNKTYTDPIITGQASAPTYAAGKMWYDSTDQTMRYYNDSTGDSINIGQEINVRIRNTSGSTITAGQALRITGGVSSRPTVALAQANAFATSKVFAIATETIVNNANGYATISGLIKNLNLSAYTVGDELYLSSSVAGGLTNVRPVSPNYAQPIGAVADNSSSTGRLIVDFGARRGVGYGSADQMLGMNAAGTQPEYKTATATRTAILPTQTSQSGKFLQTNGTDVSWVASSGGLAPVATTSTVALAVVNTMYSCTSTGGFQITLPTIPALGAVIGVMDAGETCSATNYIRVAPATGQSIDGYAANDTLSLDYARANAVFYAAPGATSWKVQYQATSMVGAGQLPGATTTIAAGYVGNYTEALGTLTALTSTNYSVTANAGVLLDVGVYDIQVFGQISPAATTTLSSITLFVSTSNGNNTTGIDFQRNVYTSYHGNITNANGDSWRVNAPVYRVVVTTPTTYYPKIRADFGTSTCQGIANIFVRRA